MNNDFEIKAAIKSLKKILCDEDFFYQVPDYQRPYAWDKDNIADLIDDLLNAYQNNENEKYFCGSLVLVNNQKDNRYDIIDGQQRITTFIILSCVLRDFYKNDLGNKAKRLLINSVQDQDDDTKRKLTLLTDENYQNIFEQEVLKKINLEEKGRQSIENKYPNNKYLQNAHYLKIFLEEKKIENINDFVEWIFENVVLTNIICPNQDTAIQIFNVLNDRGMPLSSVDILKSHLMQKLSDEDRKAFKNQWDKINNCLKNDDLNMEGLFNMYLYYTITSNPKTSLHKELLASFKNKNSLELINELEKFAECYIDILTSQDKYIYCLKYLKHTIYWQSILITAEYKKYKDIEKLKKILVAYYFQNWIAGGTTARIKQTSFNILKMVKENKDISEIQKEINDNMKKYGTALSFKEGLKSNYVYGKPWCKPLLLLLEYFAKDNSNQNFIPLDNKTQVEHILPQNAKKGWEHFTDAQKEQWTNALGNLTLLSGRKNVQASNSSFEEKKKAYMEKDNIATSFEITRQVFENDKWGEEELSNRQGELGDKLQDIFTL